MKLMASFLTDSEENTCTEKLWKKTHQFCELTYNYCRRRVSLHLGGGWNSTAERAYTAVHLIVLWEEGKFYTFRNSSLTMQTQNSLPDHIPASAWMCIWTFSPAWSYLVLHIQLIYKQYISTDKCWVTEIWHYNRGLKTVCQNHRAILSALYQFTYATKSRNSTIRRASNLV